jgi:hypothetical protein
MYKASSRSSVHGVEVDVGYGREAYEPLQPVNGDALPARPGLGSPARCRDHDIPFVFVADLDRYLTVAGDRR